VSGGLAAVNADLTDAPHDHETPVWDEAQVRASDLMLTRARYRVYSVAARADAAGRLAALSMVFIDPVYPEWGFQGLTVVSRAHRGHRLGMLIKVAMLEWLAGREPQLRQIVTGNADSNKHMIAINDVIDHWPSWELDVSQVLPAG